MGSHNGAKGALSVPHENANNNYKKYSQTSITAVTHIKGDSTWELAIKNKIYIFNWAKAT